MSLPNPKKHAGQTAGEVWSMIFGLGSLIGFGMACLQPILDWHSGALKTLTSYLLLALVLCVPFVLGFVICIWFVRKNRR